MQQLDQGQHELWSGQEVLQYLRVETKKNEVTQNLPSTLHQGSVFTPSKRQRKSVKPSRVPPSYEKSLSADETCAPRSLLQQQERRRLEAPAPVPMDNTVLVDCERSEKMEPSLSSVASISQTGKWQHLNAAKNHELPVPTNFIHQKNGWNLGSAPIIDEKILNGIMKNGEESFTHLLNVQQIEKNPDLLCSTVCRNVACRAQISPDASFCRCCSCCICKLFDDNKDPSLWILCGTETGGCGLSCHIECALKQHVAGVVTTTDRTIPSLDGSFFCQSCGAITPLIGCWKEQLLIAKDAQSVDVLRYRLFLCSRLLKGTKWLKNAVSPIDEAVKKLDAEVGQITTGPTTPTRCSVNRLSCNLEVQRLINLALERASTLSLESVGAIDHRGHDLAPSMVCFEDVRSSSIVVTVNGGTIDMKPKLVGYKLWHRRASEPSYADTPTSIIYNTDEKFVVSNLHPLTYYTFKVVPFSVDGDLAVCEAGCSTTGVEQVEPPPMDVYASLDVVLINAKKLADGNPRCITQSFEVDYTMDEHRRGGLKIQDLDEVLIDQHEQARNVMSKLPSTKLAKKGNTECFNHSSSPFGKADAMASQERGGHSNAARMQQERMLYSVAGSSPSKLESRHTSIHNVSMRKSRCVSLECPEEAASRRQSHLRCPEPKHNNKQEFLLDTRKCLCMKKFCSTTEKAKPTKAIRCEHPSERWFMQVHSNANTITTNTQADVEMVNGHTAGALTCNTEAEFNKYEFSVKVIRWLECEGHLKEEFRMKFLTWYTLRATEHEKRVVSVFIDTLQDDPASLAGQLVDAFDDIIGSKRQPSTGDDYSNRLW